MTERWPFSLVLATLAACASPSMPSTSPHDGGSFLDRTPPDKAQPLFDAGPPPDQGTLPDRVPLPPDGALSDTWLPYDAPPAFEGPAGLRLLGVGDLTGLAHSRELAVDGDLIFIADANGLPVLRSHPNGRLEVLRQLSTMRDYHCSTVALHTRSRTLVCAAADTGTVDFVDVRDPARPVSRPWVANEHDTPGNPPIYEIADAEVSGDVLWLAAHRNGLLRVELGADGRPVSLRRTGRGVDVTNVLARHGRLYLTDRSRGILVFSERDLTAVAERAVDGPLLDLDVQDERVAVALGSEGARVYRFTGTTFTETAAVQPRCVATGVALSNDFLAVACLSGLSLYDLAVSPPRLAGFFPARFGMLDVAFGPHGLLATDWFAVVQFAVARDGKVVLPEVPHALRLPPGTDARIAVRNPGPEPFTAVWRLASAHGGSPTREGTLELPPFGDAVLTLPAALLDAAGSRHNSADVLVFRPGATEVELAVAPRTRVWHRAPTDAPSRGVVAIGDRFPTLRRTTGAMAPATLPALGMETLVMFLTIDCYLQWPQLTDMAWDVAHRRSQPAPLVFFLTQMDEDPFDPSTFMRSHAAGNLPTYEWADYSRSVEGQEGEGNPVRAFEMSFLIRTPGADYPHDYRLGADGVVLDTLRMYRGRWHLRAH
jgi:hypothetical protein